GSKNGWNQQSHPQSAENDYGFAGAQDGPPASDQPTRHAAAKEVAEVRRYEWNPERNQSLLRIDALGDKVDREPVSDKEPDRVSHRACRDDAPGLRQLNQFLPGQRRTGAFFRRPFLIPVVQNHF